MKKVLTLLLTVALLLPAFVVHADVRKVSLDKCIVTFSKKSYTYTGVGITPTPNVHYKNKKLKKDRDYTIYYRDNVNVGVATVTLVGVGNYSGSTTATFQITKGKQVIKAANIKATYGDEPIYISTEASNPLTYQSSNRKVCTVNKVGMVTIVGAGKAKITIHAEGNSNVRPAKKIITVSVRKASATVIAFGGLLKKGEKWDLHAETTSGGKLTFKSSNERIAMVSKKGIVKAKRKGKVTITIRSSATKNYRAGSAKVVMEVK
ncbi:Ig-like domain (group 2) [Lachnospiraceae bacterium XBB1006]|nr:Ig-like domain (group 2) [Lachnospiraceae bacterium XBB1006]